MLIKKYGEDFSVGAGHHCETELDQDAVLLRRYLYLRDLETRILLCHTLYFALDLFLRGFDLIFKKKIPQCGTIPGSAWQLALPDIESIQEITLDEIVSGQGEFFLLSDGVESNESSHMVFTLANQQPDAVSACLAQFPES